MYNLAELFLYNPGVSVFNINWDSFLYVSAGDVCVVEQAAGAGIFHNITFTLIGFDADAVMYQQLADMIHDNGGVILTLTLRLYFRQGGYVIVVVCSSVSNSV